MKWNNMKDGLPPVGEALIVTIYDSIRNRRELRYPVTYRKCFYSDDYAFFQYGHDDGILLPEFSQVLAWAVIPKPFEEETQCCMDNSREEYIAEVDWSKVAVDTPILVSDDNKHWYRSYFADYQNEEQKVIAWKKGRTSWSVYYDNHFDVSNRELWNYAKLAEA